MRVTESSRLMKTIRRGTPCLALFLAVAANAAPKEKPSDKGETRVEVQPAAGGLMITQRLKIPDDVRSDYESAVRMLEAKRYEPGIAALIKVTERAPELAAAHINLGIAYARLGDLD